MTPVLRLAVQDDAPAIAALARASVLELFPAYYDERQTASSAEYIAVLDRALIDDGTYFVHDACAEAARAEGFRSLALMATLPGVPLYRAFGFAETGSAVLTLPDGVTAPAVSMSMQL